MADYATRLLDLYKPPATVEGVPPEELAPAPAPTPTAPMPSEAQLLSQLKLQQYITDLQQNPATMQPEGLLAGFDKARAGAAQQAMWQGQPSPDGYTGPTLQDLQRLERAQQEAQAQLYAASRI